MEENEKKEEQKQTAPPSVVVSFRISRCEFEFLTRLCPTKSIHFICKKLLHSILKEQMQKEKENN